MQCNFGGKGTARGGRNAHPGSLKVVLFINKNNVRRLEVPFSIQLHTKSTPKFLRLATPLVGKLT